MGRLVLLFVWYACAVSVRRLVRGPRRPRWSWALEVVQALVLRVARWDRHLPVPRIRARAEQLAQRARNLPGVVSEPEAVGTLHAEWFRPTEDAELPVVLYLHGGAYTVCSINTHRALLGRVARTVRAQVLAIEYRLAPEHPYPAALDDAVDAYRWLLEQGHAPGRVAVAGDSAGGGLTLALLQRLRDLDLPTPACGYCLSPWTDLAGTGASMQSNNGWDYLPAEAVVDTARHYAGEADLRTPGVSPLYGSFAGLPPLLIQVGSAEILLDDARRAAERARADGVAVELEVWEDMLHVFQAFGTVAPESGEALEKAGQFIRTHTAAAGLRAAG